MNTTTNRTKMSLHLNSIINAISSDLREVKIVEFKESFKPDWLLFRKWTPTEIATVKDVANNEMFHVREGDIKWHSKGSDVVIFVDRRKAI